MGSLRLPAWTAAALALGACGVVLLAACGTAPSVRPELLVVVDGDVTGLDAVHVDVTGPDGDTVLSRAFPLGVAPGELRLPISFGVAARNGDAARVVTIVVEGRTGATARVRQTVRSAFVAGEVRRVDVFLARSCETLYASCEAMSLTCRAGACATPMLDASTLPPAHPDGGTPPDAGPTCTSAGAIVCGGSTTGDTAAGTQLLETNACASPVVRYRGKEEAHSFTTSSTARVHVAVHRGPDTAHMMEVSVLRGGATACGATACAAMYSGDGDLLPVDFTAQPGETYWLLLDGEDADVTTTYTLDVTCDVCGDGRVTSPEQCDDANTGAGDGCTPGCAIEPGFACTGEPSACAATTCGDHTTQRGETCDDGNATDGDGCSSHCLAEVFTGISLDAPSATIPGSFDEPDATWSRADETCTFDAMMGPSRYDTYVVENTGSQPIVLSAQAAWSGDGFLFAYAPPFDATMPLGGCLLADDDFMGSGASRIEGLPVAPGAQVVLVASEFTPFSAAGPYTLSLAAVGP